MSDLRPASQGNASKGCPDRAATWLRVALVGIGAWFLLSYVALAAQRIGYPFELNYIESASVDHIARITAGRPIYVAPSIEFVPLVYTPLYYYVSAAVSCLLGGTFLAPRLVSFVASLASMVLIFAIVAARTREVFAAFTAATFFAATFDICGGWFDLARVDSLFLALTLAAVYVLGRDSSPMRRPLAGILLALAVLTKQSAGLVAIALVAAEWRRTGRGALTLLLVFGIVMAFASLGLEVVGGRWFFYYVLRVAGAQGVNWAMVWRFWVVDLVFPLGIASVLAVWFVRESAAGSVKVRDTGYLLAAAGAMMAASWHGRATVGGFPNALMPACAAIAVLVGLALHHASRAHETRRWLEVATLVASLCQFCALLYTPQRHLPQAADLRAMDHLVRTLRTASGAVLVPDHSHLASLAGKPSFAHGAAMLDVLNADPERGFRQLVVPLRGAIRDRQFVMIVLDRPNWIAKMLARCYEKPEPVFGDRGAGWPVAGYRTRPELLYRRRPACSD